MAQNRKPPAYMEYASDMMARLSYRAMSLDARGLLYTMRLECWVNKKLPSEPGSLAKVLGFDRTEVAQTLPAVMVFFHDDGEHITCPELEDYRAHREGVRQAQSEGGKAGAGITNEKRRGKKSDSAGAGTPSGMPSSTPSSPEMSRVEQSRVEKSESLSQALDDDFVADYETTEAAADAYRATRG